jgi:hypothetical protein
MGKITISGDSLEEIQATLDSLAGNEPAAAPVAGDAPKATRSRSRKAPEAPAPIQPGEAPIAPAANPFAPAPAAEAPAEAPAAAAPFAPPAAPFAPAAPAADPHANAFAERPVVTKLKGLLDKLGQQHGVPQVYAWAMQKCLALPATLTKEDFLSTVIHQQSDAALEAVYKEGGGV